MLTTMLVGLAASRGLLVVDMLAIGRLENGKWTNLVSRTTDPVSKMKNLDCQVLGLDRVQGRTTLPKLDLQSDVAEGWFALDEKWSSKVLWSGTRLGFPQARISTEPKKTDYFLIGEFLIRTKLNTAPKRMKRRVVVDLDADGKMEVVVEASSGKDMVERTMNQGPRHDYTAILIQDGRTRKVVTVSHHDARGDGVLSAADELRTIADFDGDGRYELVCSANYYEGQAASVYSYRNGVVKRLVRAEAGV